MIVSYSPFIIFFIENNGRWCLLVERNVSIFQSFNKSSTKIWDEIPSLEHYLLISSVQQTLNKHNFNWFSTKMKYLNSS